MLRQDINYTRIMYQQIANIDTFPHVFSLAMVNIISIIEAREKTKKASLFTTSFIQKLVSSYYYTWVFT